MTNGAQESDKLVADLTVASFPSIECMRLIFAVRVFGLSY